MHSITSTKYLIVLKIFEWKKKKTYEAIIYLDINVIKREGKSYYNGIVRPRFLRLPYIGYRLSPILEWILHTFCSTCGTHIPASWPWHCVGDISGSLPVYSPRTYAFFLLSIAPFTVTTNIKMCCHLWRRCQVLTRNTL